MKNFIVIVLLISGWLFHCGDSGTEVSGGNRALQKKLDEQNKQADKVRRDDYQSTGKEIQKKELIINLVKFTSEAIAGTDLEIEAVLGRDDPEVEIHYQWYVNDKPVADAPSPVLPARNFKGNDWVVCFVKAVKDGRTLQTVKSKFIRILALPPQLSLEPVTVPDIPGVFTYHIKATDPNPPRENKDGIIEERKLEYELVSPKGEGIILNPDSGQINWEITKEIVEKFAGKITLKFKVKNNEGAEVIGTLLLNFTQQEK